MMWQGAYFEWAKTAAAGYLTQPEMEANWKMWDENPEHPRDWDGPRGFMQLAIPGHTKELMAWNRLEHAKSIQQEQKLNKNITEDKLRQKQQQSQQDMAQSQISSTWRS